MISKEDKRLLVKATPGLMRDVDIGQGSRLLNLLLADNVITQFQKNVIEVRPL